MVDHRYLLYHISKKGEKEMQKGGKRRTNRSLEI
jgi:hypothetical protein